MDHNLLRSLVSSILEVAGTNEDRFQRELGEIHIIKYLYIVDLLHFQHCGKTLTGIDWFFHNFGPWSCELHQALESLMPTLPVLERIEESRDGKYESKRWVIADSEPSLGTKDVLPFPVIMGLKRHIREYGRNTSELLHFVYATEPMLHAAPGERLDFSTVVVPTSKPKSDPGPEKNMTVKQAKRWKERVETAQVEIQRRREERKKKRKPAPLKPIYDDVYYDGLRLLDSLAGAPLPAGEYVIEVSDEIWKSQARTEKDVP